MVGTLTNSVAGIPLKIGGVTLAHPKGLGGHSDGDVLLHALTDALLGAVAAPDIGSLFPPSDPQVEGCRLCRFLARGFEAGGGGGLCHCQCGLYAHSGCAQDRPPCRCDPRTCGGIVGRIPRIALASKPKRRRAWAPTTRRSRTPSCCWRRRTSHGFRTDSPDKKFK